jgi:hypothetical protein
MGPPLRFSRDPMLRLLLCGKIANVRIGTVARHHADEPSTALEHFRRELRYLSRHARNMRTKSAAFHPPHSDGAIGRARTLAVQLASCLDF